jgi:hypothetical protein
MPKAPKPTKLLFGVKTAKRRTAPKQYQVSIILPAEKADLFFEYVAAEIKKMQHIVSTQENPPGYVNATTFTPKAAVSDTQTSNPQE